MIRTLFERRFGVRRHRMVRAGRIGLVLAAAALVLTGCSAHDVEKRLRFGWPTGVTREGQSMRTLWTWAGVAALVLGAIVWGLIFWACLRYRKRDDRLPRQTKYNLFIEAICIIVPFLILIPLFYRTVVVENRVNELSDNPDLVVQVDAFKWNWEFEYQKAANKTLAYNGVKDQRSGSKGMPVFLNTVGSDDEIPVLVIPVNQSVQLVEHSEDVVHSFWVPEFLFKRDVIPYGTPADQKASGLTDNRFQFTATQQGSYVGRCAELCGTYHSQMNFEARVVSSQVFQAYLAALSKLGPDDPARQHEALMTAHVPGGGYATTTHPFLTDRSARQASGG